MKSFRQQAFLSKGHSPPNCVFQTHSTCSIKSQNDGKKANLCLLHPLKWQHFVLQLPEFMIGSIKLHLLLPLTTAGDPALWCFKREGSFLFKWAISNCGGQNFRKIFQSFYSVDIFCHACCLKVFLILQNCSRLAKLDREDRGSSGLVTASLTVFTPQQYPVLEEQQKHILNAKNSLCTYSVFTSTIISCLK